MKKLICLLSFILLSTNCLPNGTWSQISIYNGGAIDMPICFTIGNKAYTGAGRDSLTSFRDDFWEFNPITNTWAQKANYPGGQKADQASFVINNKGYVGLGFDLGYHDEFYEYDPAINLWTQKATFPGGARYASMWFSIGNSGYIIGGWAGSGFNDCWEYTPATDTWIQKANYPGGDRLAGIGFTLNNMGYVCGGYIPSTSYNDLWQFDPVSNTWASKAPFPGSPRRGFAGFVINNEAYVGVGYDDITFQTAFYKYDPINDSWVQETDFGGSGRYHPMYFVIDNKGYVGCGSSGTVQNPVYFDDVWVFEPSGDYNLIQGKEYIDFNSNNTQDSAEPALINKKIIESTTGNIAFTNQSGFYSLAVYDTGNFEVTPVDIINYFAPVPSDYPVNFGSMLQVDTLNDFACQPSGVYDDLCITMTPGGNFRSGMNASYIVSYSNVGNTTLNGTIMFYLDTNLTFVSSNPAATTVSGDSVEIAIGTLTPFQTGQVIVTVNVDLGLPLGTLISSSATILPIVGDANPYCNVASWDQTVTGSYDPNDITVNKSVIYDYEVPSQPELEYIIRFQNTGNDTAFTVRIMNPIDLQGLEINSLEYVASSHPATMTWLPAEQSMRFLFENILLADSNVNEPMSHGFIRYKIKPKTSLLVGDSITSQAFIFFDFNSAVPTNVTRTDIIEPSGIKPTVKAGSINVYPNPVNSMLTIQLNNSGQKKTSLGLYNVYGQKIRNMEFETTPGNISKTIDVSDLASGIYFIKVLDESTVKRFVKY